MKIDFEDAMKSAVDANSLSEMLTIAATQNPDATLRIGEDGSLNIRTLGMDNITAVDLNGIPGFFTGEVPQVPVGVEIARWLDALKKCQGDAVIEWKSGAVRISTGRMSTVVRLFEPTQTRKFPNLDLKASAMFDPAPMKDLMASVPPKVYAPWTVEISPDGVRLSAYEDTGMGTEIFLKSDELIVLSAEDTQVGHYSRDCWGKLIKALPKGPIGVELTKDFPCKVTFGGDSWSGSWVCAPMVMEVD